ncbi:MAG: hypothetical protein ACXVFL_04305 [Solirubrobacteraceae bacterium]
MSRTRTLVLSAVAVGALAAPVAAGATATPPPGGQPNQDCEALGVAPKGFSSGGFANAKDLYAGSGPGSAHAVSGNAVSQYDVACFQQFSH